MVSRKCLQLGPHGKLLDRGLGLTVFFNKVKASVHLLMPSDPPKIRCKGAYTARRSNKSATQHGHACRNISLASQVLPAINAGVEAMARPQMLLKGICDGRKIWSFLKP